MPRRYLLPFGPFAPDAGEYNSPALDVSKNALPMFGARRPVRQKSVIASAATTGAITGAHAHLLLATEQIQYGRPSADRTDGNWLGFTGETNTNLYSFIDETTASDADYILVGGAPSAEACTVDLQSLDTPGSNSHILRWRYKVSGYSATAASVSSITRAGTTATVTTAAAHGLATNDTVNIAGATQTEYNGNFPITVTGATTFTYTVSGTPATPATGTITWKKGWRITAALQESATVRATSTAIGSADAAWTQVAYTLTAGEYAAITSYSGLRVTFTATVPGVVQELRPSADRDNTGLWTTGGGSASNLYAEIDETATDDATTYIKTPILTSSSTRDYTTDLQDGSDPYRNSSTHTVSYRYRATNAGTTLVVTLMQGSTTIATQTVTNASTSWTTGTLTLSTAEAAAITDWTDLRLRFQASYTTGTTSTVYQQALATGTSSSAGFNASGAATPHEALDEASADDGDYIFTGSGGLSGGEANLTITALTDPLVHEDHILRYRAYKNTTASGITVQVQLYQGSTQIASSNQSLTTTTTTYTYNLTASEMAAITDYGDLSVKIATSDDDVHVTWFDFRVPEPRRVYVSWAELETPSLARAQVSWLELQIPDPNNTYNADAQEIYAGTQTAIYEVEPSGFTDKSLAGGYATSGDTPHSWSFASWGGDVIATNYINEVQVLAAGGANFANLITSTERPNARFVTVVGPHLVLGDIINTGGTITGYSDMVWWSAIEDSTDFDPDPATQCDYQRLRDTPGQIMGLVGGIDYGLVFKRNSIYRLNYVGPPLIFIREAISSQVGTPAPRSIVQVGEDVYFWAGDGFTALRSGRSLERVGEGRVVKMLIDHAFEDRAIKQTQVSDQRTMDALIFGAYDKSSGLIFWSYRGSSDDAHKNDKVIVYNPRTQDWGMLDDTGLDCAALLSLNNVSSDDTHLHKGIAGFSWDGTNSSWWKFNSTDTYAVTLSSKILTSQAITGEDEAMQSVRIVSVRPLFRGQPEASTDPLVTITVQASNDPLMQVGVQTGTATQANVTYLGDYPVSPPVVGEYFTLSMAVPSLSSQTLIDTPGVEVYYEVGGERG